MKYENWIFGIAVFDAFAATHIAWAAKIHVNI
jgi:hypothetical protein